MDRAVVVTADATARRRLHAALRAEGIEPHDVGSAGLALSEVQTAPLPAPFFLLDLRTLADEDRLALGRLVERVPELPIVLLSDRVYDGEILRLLARSRGVPLRLPCDVAALRRAVRHLRDRAPRRGAA